MSLKAFHLFFITVSICLAGFFGFWCVREFAESESLASLSMGIGAFLSVVGLVLYLGWFLKKSKSIGYIAIAALVYTLFSSQSALACATCYGNPNSPMVKAANAGVWFLMVVIGGVLSTFVSLFVYWARKAKQVETPLP